MRAENKTDQWLAEKRHRASERRRRRTIEKRRRQRGNGIECPDCGGIMPWCTACEMYTQVCCIEYGTCQCS